MHSPGPLESQGRALIHQLALLRSDLGYSGRMLPCTSPANPPDQTMTFGPSYPFATKPRGLGNVLNASRPLSSAPSNSPLGGGEQRGQGGLRRANPTEMSPG